MSSKDFRVNAASMRALSHDEQGSPEADAPPELPQRGALRFPRSPASLGSVRWSALLTVAGTIYARLRASRWEAAVYLGSRLLILWVALAEAVLMHTSLGSELSNWDGAWYLAIVHHGYPSHVPAGQSTLGFLPVYPLLIVIVSRLTFISPLLSGLLVSGVAGFATVVLVEALVKRWWGSEAGRWAVVILCRFPGSVVFSMVYPEGLTAALGAGCLLALAKRRWVVAGICAALAGAVEPVGLVAIPVCILVAFMIFFGDGADRQEAKRSLLAPAIAPLGIGGFAFFLWAWTGTPFASLDAQVSGWHQSGNPIALILHILSGVASDPVKFLSHHAINLDFVSGLAGAVFLVMALNLLWRRTPALPVEALAWAAGIGLLTLWSIRTPPNARILIVAFPAIVVWADHLDERSLKVFAIVEAVLLAGMSALTFHGRILSP
ncbi:MAG: mannosyltransferase family protein [Acidimicrobiales bacterium]